MHSKNGIWYTLADSPWWVMNYYDGAIIRFYFSSETHFNRFKREVNACESRMTATMSKRIGCFIDMRIPAAIQLYRRVENRGFYIVVESDDGTKEYTCLDQLELDGLKVRLAD